MERSQSRHSPLFMWHEASLSYSHKPTTRLYRIIFLYSTYCKTILKSFFYGRQICSLSLQLCMHYSSSHAGHTLGPSHPPWFHNLEGIRSRVQITKFFINRSAKCLPKDRQPTLFLGSDSRMNRRRCSIVQLLHCITITFLFVLCSVVKRHANFGR
jgi:hypothetical protein